MAIGSAARSTWPRNQPPGWFAACKDGLAILLCEAYYKFCLSIGCSRVLSCMTPARRTLELFVG